MKLLPLQPPRRRPEEPEHPFAGQLEYQGVRIDVETRAGDYRRGVSPEGEAWAVRLPCHYGEVRGTVGADGDPVDVFVGPDPFAPFVYVVQSKFPGSKAFDETKSMLGFRTQADALECFRAAYTKPGFYLGVKTWPIGAWKEAVMNRPKVARGMMMRPLSKAARPPLPPMTIDPAIIAAELEKGSQLGLFGGAGGSSGAGGGGGGSRVSRVKPHTRQTRHGPVYVRGHDRVSEASSSGPSSPSAPKRAQRSEPVAEHPVHDDFRAMLAARGAYESFQGDVFRGPGKGLRDKHFAAMKVFNRHGADLREEARAKATAALRSDPSFAARLARAMDDYDAYSKAEDEAATHADAGNARGASAMVRRVAEARDRWFAHPPLLRDLAVQSDREKVDREAAAARAAATTERAAPPGRMTMRTDAVAKAPAKRHRWTKRHTDKAWKIARDIEEMHKVSLPDATRAQAVAQSTDEYVRFLEKRVDELREEAGDTHQTRRRIEAVKKEIAYNRDLVDKLRTHGMPPRPKGKR